MRNETNKENNMENNAAVFAVSIGENCEGGTIAGIFASLESARTFCENNNSGDWEEMDSDEWVSGCDRMIIEKYKVEA
jgi:hypothetical protein